MITHHSVASCLNRLITAC